MSEAVLLKAIEAGQVGGAALDVFEEEPLVAEHPLRKSKRVILTPHLGASTAEAQESVGIEIAEAIRDYLTEGAVRNAVNIPSVDARTMAKLRPQIEFGFRLGRLLSQIAPPRCDRLTISYAGKIGEEDTTPITRSILKGFLFGAGDRGGVCGDADSRRAGLVGICASAGTELADGGLEPGRSGKYRGGDTVGLGGGLFGIFGGGDDRPLASQVGADEYGEFVCVADSTGGGGE